MKFHFSKLKNALLEPNISEHSIVKNLSLVSKGFTSDRKKITEYVMDRSMVSAYTLFYLPSNMPKLGFVFDMLSDELKADIKNSKVVDLGTGPGTFAFALDEYFDGDITIFEKQNFLIGGNILFQFNYDINENTALALRTITQPYVGYQSTGMSFI